MVDEGHCDVEIDCEMCRRSGYESSVGVLKSKMFHLEGCRARVFQMVVEGKLFGKQSWFAGIPVTWSPPLSASFG